MSGSVMLDKLRSTAAPVIGDKFQVLRRVKPIICR